MFAVEQMSIRVLIVRVPLKHTIIWVVFIESFV